MEWATTSKRGNLQTVGERDRVGGHPVEGEGADRLRGFAEAELIGDHHAVAGIREGADHRVPVARRKVAPVQQQHRAAIRVLGGRHIHVGEALRLAIAHQRQEAHREGIGEAFEADAERRLLLGPGNRR
jgi:hypothetical protein